MSIPKTTSNLPIKHESFCTHYTTLNAPTFGHPANSAAAAGFSPKSSQIQGSRLLKKPLIQARIKELHQMGLKRNALTVDKVLGDLEMTKGIAEKVGKLGVMVKCIELQGKYLAMFTDKVVNETPEAQRELSEKQKEEARKIAQIRVDQMTKEELKGKPKILPMTEVA